MEAQQHRSVPVTSAEQRPGQAQHADAVPPVPPPKQQMSGFSSGSPAQGQSQYAGTQPFGAQQQLGQGQVQTPVRGQPQMPPELRGAQPMTQEQCQGEEIGQKPGQIHGNCQQAQAGKAGQAQAAQPGRSEQAGQQGKIAQVAPQKAQPQERPEAPKRQTQQAVAAEADTKQADEKLIVITGASSGIGAAIAKEFSRAGYPLLLIARRKEEMEAHELPNCMCESVDVRDSEAFCAAVRKAEQRYGPTCCLINDAAVCYMGDMADQDPSEWSSMVSTNILGFMHGVQAVLKDMKERECGTIINITSVTAHKSLPNFGAYTATKAAVLAMMENIREQVACCGVRIICISPGVVDTDFVYRTTEQKYKDEFDEMVEKDLKNEMLQPEDVARACLFAYQQPKHVTIRELIIAPTQEQK